ncbi:ectonucleoside triphosphate diphosphohydrolase 5 [Papilio machaon]|uniref:ectonucleoside triphosphate diphosphohydrolase 5 n=1 Tax=Papilio machaon TaxID=76193 RepID=UPI001E6659C1|nr:ectonucleoside triphosphate diphosphohydrolase 5 [Papilio machaon]
MGKFSTYRYLELKESSSLGPVSSRSISLKRPRRLKRVFILLIVVAVCGTYLMGLLAGQPRWLDGLAKSLGYESAHHYAVVIDAGSSGTRVLAYKFRVPFAVFGEASLDLVEEYFEQSKPGLSSYADDPEKGAESVVSLVRKAEGLTPAAERARTPLLVRATAGLRLLPPHKAQRLLEHVARALARLGYAAAEGGADVQIMDGSDEGVFIWYTLNLLHDLMLGETMAALDLGGGSTQITFQLQEEEAARAQPADTRVLRAGAANRTLYTHSYLRLGLLAARHGLLQHEAGADRDNFTTVCVDPIVQAEPWTYAGRRHLVSGAPRPPGMKREAAYARCHALVRAHTLRTLGAPPPRAPPAAAAMSYFYDVAADAGLIDVMSGGRVSVAQYRAAAVRACSAANVDQPWACLDLAFVTALLHDAYGIRDDDHVSLFKKVNGHEVSWALGLAYTTVRDRLAAAPTAPGATPAPAA